MAKRVFFSFHYQDVVDFRANVVRNHWVTKLHFEDAGYFDASLWENAKLRGNNEIKRVIDSGLINTSVTCILIGSETYSRKWVRYEILKSFFKGNYIIGVHINSITGKDGQTKLQGPNPLEFVGVTYSKEKKTATLWEKVNNQWCEYNEIDGTSTFGWNYSGPEDVWGKGYNLGQFFPVYDWVSDNGYQNFSDWVCKIVF